MLIWACDSKNKVENDTPSTPWVEFEHFPHAPFLNLDFKHTAEENKNILKKDYQFQQKDSYWTKDSMAIKIDGNQDKTKRIKLYLRGENYLNHSDEFLSYLKSKSEHSKGQSPFVVMDFNDKNQFLYTLTYFKSPQSIRLWMEISE